MKDIDTLTLQDLSLIKESLKYTKLKFEEYQGYPSYEFKQGRVQEATEVLDKISNIIKANKA